ncbi:YhdT family protein [Mitsuokella sp.]|mgnify:CR=1 FL=1|uniref:YhdT family protein n=1 Tax=Mitsuokella TaxID=52225 RepID=UPI0029E0810B|nr:YhdT family protein [Mitsuokella sp.]MDD6382617.1 YhdT family protein [Selenomonadaceae bacterium]MDY4474167.1 YhdT family protein [Mitsuokella sp.]
MNNYEKYQQVKKEAGATGVLLLVLIVFWMVAGFGLSGVQAEFLHLPVWVWMSSIGVWIFAIAGVRALTHFVFRDMPLEDEEVARHGK